MEPSLLERILLALLTATSLLLFWRRFGAVLKIIRSARGEPGYQVSGWPRRLRNFVWEVVLQARVIRERPWPGIAHALVFWGFCCFALVTLDHFARGFGLPLLNRQSGLGALYFPLASLFAVAVAIAITGLAVRRFLIRPRWLGALSWQSGLIAALIFTLMVTFLAEHWHWAQGAAAGGVWWLHSLAILVFLPLVPHTKHLHLLLSPFTVLLKREGFSQIPPLAGDEDFGLLKGTDLTQPIALQAFTCVECGRCTQHCPAANTGKVLDPKEIILGLRNHLNEFGPAAEQPLLGKHLSQEALFQCTTCGACEYQCPVGVQHLPAIIGLRRGAVNTGEWEDDHGAKIFLNLERYGNPLGLSANERTRFIAKAKLPIFDGSQEYCLWLGCMGSYDPRGREVITALARLLDYLEITYGVLPKESCTGDAARRLGNDLQFTELASANLDILRSAGVKKLLSICPHCVRTIGEDWKELGAAIPIEHHSELLARNHHRLPANGFGARPVAFHDPCYLGRYRGIYDAPREVIAGAGAAPLDPPRSRQRGFCCGAGGGLTFLGEEKGKRISHERAGELIATGARQAGVACPFCNSMLTDALRAVSQNPPELLDIAEIAAAGLPR